MAIYAYCLLRMSPDDILPDLRGVDGRPVFPLRCDKYAMLLSRMERSFPFSARSIVEHGQVISRVFENHTVLPIRFGTFFRSEQQITDLIRGNRQDLLESFCRLRGKAEMRLKLLLRLESGVSGDSRRLPQKSFAADGYAPVGESEPLDPECREVAGQLSATLNEMFHPLAQQVNCRRLASRELLVDCAHLIETQQLASYQKVCLSAGEQIKDGDLRVSGPWPPYHFLPATVRLPAPALLTLRSRAPSRVAAAVAH